MLVCRQEDRLKIYRLLNPDGTFSESEVPGTLGGNSNGKLYGRLDCRSANEALPDYATNRVFFEDEAAAIAAGYRPCYTCMREQWERWKPGARLGTKLYPWKKPPPKRPGLTPDSRDRAVGALLGLAAGDAVGTTLEFKTRDTYDHLIDMVGGGPFGLEPGQWTDDTSMALCLADSLCESGGLDPGDLMDRFCRWWRDGENSSTGECFDIGNATTSALSAYEATGDPFSGSTDERSAGNGSIMRLAPIAIYRHDDPDRAARDAVEQGRTTHGALECLGSCELFAHVLADLIGGRSWPSASSPRGLEGLAPRVADIDAGTWRRKDRDAISSNGYVIHTLEAAMWCVDRTESFRDAVLLAANLGEDADTVAAVTGQVAGARYGATGIPEPWLAKLYDRERIERLAGELFERR